MKSRLIMLFFSVFCFSLDAMSPEEMGVVRSQEMTKITLLSDFVGKGFLDRPSQYGACKLDELEPDVKTNIASLYSDDEPLAYVERRKSQKYVREMRDFFERREDRQDLYRDLCDEANIDLKKLENEVKENRANKGIIRRLEERIRASKEAIRRYKREILDAREVMSRFQGQAKIDKVSRPKEVISRIKGQIIREKEKVRNLQEEILIEQQGALRLQEAISQLKLPMLILPEKYGLRLERLSDLVADLQRKSNSDSEEFSSAFDLVLEDSAESSAEELPEEPVERLSVRSAVVLNNQSNNTFFVCDVEDPVGPSDDAVSNNQPNNQASSNLFAGDNLSFLQKNGMRIGLIMALGGALMCAASASQLMCNSSKA